MEPGRRPWQQRCPRCGYLAAALEPGPESAASVIDEERREKALAALRQANFERELDQLERFLKPQGRTLLDVGCAHGWFLSAAARRGWEVTGIEPDARIAAFARSHGHRVLAGYFPDAVPPTHFDVIAFNDVFEHLPDPDAALEACREHLQPGGLLLLNVPSSAGALFRAATLLDRVGVGAPLDRMWQKGFPSPHLSYFHPGCLAPLARRHGFDELHRCALRATGDGLWERLRYDRSGSLALAVPAWCALTLARPVLALLTSDTELQLFARRG